MTKQYKKYTNEDKFARMFYCNSYRFTHNLKKRNRKKFRQIQLRKNKTLESED